MMQNSMNIEDKLRNYQEKVYNTEKYEGGTLKLANLRFECSKCKIHFTPSESRAKNLMDKKGVINECKECEKGNNDVY